MAKMFFVNLPVKDVAASTAFYEAIGCVRDPRFSGDHASSMKWSDEVMLMLLRHDFYATLTPKPIADAHTVSTALYALSLDSRAAVDDITAKAVAAGGREAHDAEDMGFMYSRAFEDLDGNGFGPFWMDVDATPAAQSANEPCPA